MSNNTMTTLEKAIEFNNHGTSLMDAGNPALAIPFLSRGLNHVHKIIEDTTFDSREQEVTRLDECMRRGPLLETKTCSFFNKQDVFIYQRSIKIPTSMDRSRSCINILVMIIFNLALAHHLSALNDDIDYTLKLRQAADLYELGYKTLQNGPIRINGLFYVMATVNNLGTIYQSLGEDKISRKFFQHLLSTHMYAIYCDETQRSDYSNFFKNTFYLITKTTTSAAA